MSKSRSNLDIAIGFRQTLVQDVGEEVDHPLWRLWTSLDLLLMPQVYFRSHSRLRSTDSRAREHGNGVKTLGTQGTQFVFLVWLGGVLIAPNPQTHGSFPLLTDSKYNFGFSLFKSFLFVFLILDSEMEMSTSGERETLSVSRRSCGKSSGSLGPQESFCFVSGSLRALDK